jgi:hypothetical protein
MTKQDYVPVTGDDWYQRRREDAEGRFFRQVADQGPRKGEGGSTRQGIYMFTASGKLLAYKNAGQAPDVMRDVLRKGLAEWRRLPASERRPGGVAVEKIPKLDARYSRRPPTGGLIVDVYARILDRDSQGELCRGTCQTPGGEKAARDHLWLTEAEWKSLVPSNPKKGDQFPLPQGIAERVLRYHLVDNTRGEPNYWTKDEIRSSQLTLTVEEATPISVQLRLNGSALLATAADAERADRGYQVNLTGYVTYDAAQKSISRFDIVAVGVHWGSGRYTGGARPGRNPFGVAMELARKDRAANDVAPLGARDFKEYFGKGN